jgi:CBS domain-containing protein
MKIVQLMTPDIHFCRAQDTLAVAAEKMWIYDIGCLPVLCEDDHVIAMITDRDICMAVFTQHQLLSDLLVSSAMSKEVFSCNQNDNIKDAEETMRSHQIRRLPVVDNDGRLVGIVTLNDIAREAEREIGRKGREISAQEVTATLATIAQPRHPVISAREI